MAKNMSSKTIFITATDTDAGKTYVSTLLLQGLKQLDYQAIGVKPLAAGGNEAGYNEDALLLQQHSSNALLYSAATGAALPYSWFNPIYLPQAVAPHLAAKLNQQAICEQTLNISLQSWQQQQADLCVIEGAGGWLLPLNNQRYLADWVADNQLPVIVVVAIKLGCLNHAMLTIREIARSGCKIVGWVANCVDPQMLLLEQNIADLQQRIAQPCLAVLPLQTKADNLNSAQQAKQLASAVMTALTALANKKY